jgi:hypothetical protein
VIGGFHSEVKADEWRDRITEGFPGLSATTEWLYSATSGTRDVLREAIDDLVAEQPRFITVEIESTNRRADA